MNEGGMTLIVKNTARLVSGFVVVFAIYIALTGHLSPGGGFAGGVILAAAGALIVLSFGLESASKLTWLPVGPFPSPTSPSWSRSERALPGRSWRCRRFA